MTKQIFITMRDDYTDKLVDRAICISNFTISTGYIPGIERQRVILLDWIKERANAQHDTSLSLVSWYIK